MPEDIIVIEQFSYKYSGAEQYALKDVNLRVKRGEYVGIMGPTGAGKTTLCLALNGIVPHFYGGDFYGSVRINGMDTVEHPTYDLAEHVGMVFEDPEIQLTAPSVAREIAFALENIRTPVDEIKRRIPVALEMVRLPGMEDRHPHQLSGGQKQRLAIAAALALRPDVLVLDEPTSQLDPVGTDEVFAIARELNREHGITIVLVSHASEEVAEYADRVVLLGGGKVLAEAPPRHFFGNIKLLQQNEVRPPEVTMAFGYLLNGRSQHTTLPVTLADGLKEYETLKTQVKFRDTAVFPDDDLPQADGDILLQTDDLYFAYENGTQALQGISLSIRQGEYVAIVGQNGAGKSTLVRHFLHLIEATSGRVTVLGKDVATYSVSDLAQNIGYISQNPDNQIFSDSVENEVAFALKNLKFPAAEVEKRVADSLSEMKLEWATDHHPLNLSKGDRSRIVIAAIMAMKPDILIFDEPTTGQDYLGARAILDLTRELHRAGKTIIVITHHLYLLPGYAKRLIVMGKGKVLLDGPLREMFYQTEKLRETYLTAPQVVQFAKAIQPVDGPILRPLAAHELAMTVSLRGV